MPDPDKLLAGFRTAAQRWMSSRPTSPPEMHAAHDAILIALELDGWLSEGGNPPGAWSPQPPNGSVSGRMELHTQALPEGARHHVTFRGLADGGIGAHCEGCPEWSSRVASQHDAAAFLRCAREHDEQIQLFSRGEITQAVSDAVSLVEAGLTLGERDTDLLNLAANAARTLLGAADPDAVTLDQVLDDNYDGGAATVRGWWNGWS